MLFQYLCEALTPLLEIGYLFFDKKTTNIQLKTYIDNSNMT